MASELGAYYITIMASLLGAKKQIESQLSGVDTGVGSKLGKQISSDVAKGLSFDAVGAKFKDLGGQLEATGSQLTGAITKPFMIGAAAAGGFAALIGKSALGAYAEWEQLVGGVDTLFKGASGTVQKYAADAYKTAGLSANAYMSQVTSFSASLLQSLGGDTAAAADAANQAVIDMADNANKMGSSIGSIQDAYQGFAKQNYTMLDNLKLGYGGTKTEMERLLADATKFSGIEYDIDNLADVYEAIHVVQTEMGITGTTAEEAASTIEGSTAAMKASWSNWLAEIGKTDGDVAGATKKLTDSVVVAFRNVVPRVGEIMRGLAESIPVLWKALKAEIPKLFDLNKMVEPGSVSVLQIFVSAFRRITSFIDAAKEAWQSLSPEMKLLAGKFAAAAVAAGPFLTILGKMSSGLGGLIQWVGRLSPGLAGASGGVSGFIGNIAKFAGPVGIAIAAIAALWTQSEDFRTGIMEVGTAIWEVAQQIIQAVQPIVETVAATLLPILTQIGDVIGQVLIVVAPAIGEIGTLLAGLIVAATPLIEWLISILEPAFQNIVTVVQAVFNALGPIIEAATEVIGGIITAWTAILNGDWSAAWEAIKSVFSSAWDLIKSIVTGAIEVVYTTITSTVESIKTAWGTAWEAVKSKLDEVWEGIKKAVSRGVDKVVGTVESIKGKITGFFTGAGDWLWNAGNNIIQGFLDGLTSAFEDVKNFVGGIGDWIAAHKGPKAYDLALLVPAGRWIMTGFGDSLDDQFSKVKTRVRAYAAELSSAFGSPTLQGALAAGASIMKGLASGIASKRALFSDAIATPTLGVTNTIRPMGLSDGILSGRGEPRQYRLVDGEIRVSSDGVFELVRGVVEEVLDAGGDARSLAGVG